MKRDEKITHSNEVQVGTVVKQVEVFFTAAMPTMNRDDGLTEFNYTDDKGTGTHTEHGDMTNILINQRCVYDCSGTGTSELHTVIVREWDNTYDIEAISPFCKGTSCTGEPFEETMTITVSNEKFTNGDVLAGTKTVTAELPGKLGTVTATNTWHLTRVKDDDAELIVTPVDYDRWLPEPGKDELTKGRVMTVNLKLQGKNGKPLKVKAESFELTLFETSKEPGVTINYPIATDADQPDLRLLGDPRIESIEEAQFVSVGSADGINGKAWIASYDGGGWTTLKVEAILTVSELMLHYHQPNYPKLKIQLTILLLFLFNGTVIYGQRFIKTDTPCDKELLKKTPGRWMPMGEIFYAKVSKQQEQEIIKRLDQ